MGCICFKAAKREEKKSLKRSKREEIVNPEADPSLPGRNLQNGESSERRRERPRNLVVHQRRATVDFTVSDRDRVLKASPVRNDGAAELAAAGWPNWLVSVAGEAVWGWVPRKAESFERMDKIGQGTYSTVFKARDLENGTMVALKKVRFVNMDPESVRFMAREILILRRLDHPNIIRLKGLIASRISCSLYLIFEYMEHDLAGLAAAPGIKFTEPQVKCFMKQLIGGLEHCHGRGVLHRDIKGSNLLIDNNGVLKIADFGLATFYNSNNNHPLTSRVVTLWYRPPELLLGATVYGASVDLWSAGCILGELIAGKPIMPGRTEVEQLHKIFKLCGSPPDDFWQSSKLPHAAIFKPPQPYRRCFSEIFRDFPSSAVSLLRVLLDFDPESRGTATSALHSEFFTTSPYACDPSSLPKYPPSKEYDAKLRDEEMRRQRAAAAKDKASENGSQSQRRASRVLPPALENPESMVPATRKSASNRYSGQFAHLAAGHAAPNTAVPSRPTAVVAVQKPKAQLLAEMPQLAVAREVAKSENHRERSRHLPWPEHASRHNGPEYQDKHEWPSTSQQKEEKKEQPPVMGIAGGRRNRMHYSGPLIPTGVSMDDMLKQHERQIQQAVRKARLDKAKTKKGMGENGQLESLLHGRREA